MVLSMNKENAIEVNNITKSFKVYYDKGSELKEKMLFWKRNKYEMRQVLKGISFNVKKGEAIGLVGKNGCGKSTTLKMLTKIMYPNSGTIEMCGRVSSLIELGAGFHPDMSGRENIYTNASIFGLDKKEIDRRLDDIIAFSSISRISASTLIATENASLMYIPDEYVLTGLSMNSSSSENAIEVNNITKSFKVYYDKGSE